MVKDGRTWPAWTWIMASGFFSSVYGKFHSFTNRGKRSALFTFCDWLRRVRSWINGGLTENYWLSSFPCSYFFFFFFFFSGFSLFFTCLSSYSSSFLASSASRSLSSLSYSSSPFSLFPSICLYSTLPSSSVSSSSSTTSSHPFFFSFYSIWSFGSYAI